MSKSVVFLIIFVAAGLICGSAGAVNVIGYKFYDYNKDGIAGSNSFSLEGWTIYLQWLNGTNVSGKQAVTGPYGLYNISGVDPYFDYKVCEVLKPGWENTSPRCQMIGFVTCGGGPGGAGAYEFFTNETLMKVFMPNLPDNDSKALLGYNMRIGDPGNKTNEDDFKIFYPLGEWSPGQSSTGLSPDGALNPWWVNNTYVPFNTTWVPGPDLRMTASMQVGSNSTTQNDNHTRTQAVPIRDIVIRLHAEKNTAYTVQLNNLTLKQGSHTYTLTNSFLNFTYIDSNNQDLYYVIRASDILINQGGSDIASGGFSLTGDIRFIWPSGSSPKQNDMKVDIMVGRYDCNYVVNQVANFGNHINGSISGYKLDQNQNPLEGWNITAYNETRLELYYDVTDVNGYYNISDVNLSYYWLNETPQEGFTQVTPNRTVQINATTLNLFNQNFTNIETVYYCIEGYKIYDYDKTGVPGWNITVQDVTGAEVGNATTNASGWYRICNLSPGNYTICEELKPGWVNVSPLCQDVDINVSNVTNVNFTNTRLICMEGYKIDNCTGEGLEGWNITVKRYINDEWVEIGNATTNATGWYQICNLTLIPRDCNETFCTEYAYLVCEELKEGWTNVSVELYQVPGKPVCQAVLMYEIETNNVNFTNARLLCINGTKVNDDTGAAISGWNITVYNATAEVGNTTTDGSGTYELCGLPPGEYMVCEEFKAGWTNVTDRCQNITLVCENGTVNFRNAAEKTYCINGTKTNCSGQSNDGCPLDGWKMTVYNETSDLEVGNDTTDINGYYEICGLVPGDYWICEEERPGFTNLTDACSNFTIAEGNVTFDIQNAELTCIDGYKINNATGLGLAGWNITVSNQTAEIATVITNDTGYYKVCNLTPGYNYTVCEELKDGWTSVGPTCIDVDDLACFGAYVQFNNDPPPLYCIEGRKVDAHTGDGLAGWNITVTGEGVVLSNLTNATGYYEFCDLPDGDYTVCEELQPGWLNVSPLCYDISVDGGNVVVDDFVNDPVGNVSGYKINQGTGMGLPGWTIRLVNDTSGITYATNVTLADGSFQFLNVPFGPYRLEEIPQAGWTQVTPNTTFTIDMENREVTYDFYNAEEVSYCCECPPNAKFTYTNNGLTVDFQDTSSGPQTAKWYWVFGDGSTSSEQNPSHTYSSSGTYTVRLYIRWYDCNGVMSSYWKYYYTKVTV